MKTVSARQANHEFSDFFRVWNTERNPNHQSKPVAVLRPYRPPLMTAERKNALQHAIDVMANGLSWGGTVKRFKLGEMHEL